MSLRRDWQRLTRPETRFRGQVTRINADGTSTVQTADNRIVRVRNQPSLTVSVNSFCVVTTGREPGDLPTILRAAPALALSTFDNL